MSVFRKALFVFILVLQLVISGLLAQNSGTQLYTFLNLPMGASQAAMGGQHITGHTNNTLSAASNPAIWAFANTNSVALNYTNLYAGLNEGLLFFGKADSARLPWLMGIRYLNYGKFTAANQYGQITGEFTAADYAFFFSLSKRFSAHWSAGATFKPILSDYESYTSFALAVDAGVFYTSENNLTQWAFTIKNAGVQLKSYTGLREKLPLIIQTALSIRLAHAPFQFVVLANNLETPDLYYAQSNENYFTGFGDQTLKISKWQELGENILRHTVVGIELFPGKKINIMAGYNYRRRQELKLETRPYLAGYSFGIRMKFRNLNMELSRVFYHLSGKNTYLSLYLPLNTH